MKENKYTELINQSKIKISEIFARNISAINNAALRHIPYNEHRGNEDRHKFLTDVFSFIEVSDLGSLGLNELNLFQATVDLCNIDDPAGILDNLDVLKNIPKANKTILVSALVPPLTELKNLSVMQTSYGKKFSTANGSEPSYLHMIRTLSQNCMAKYLDNFNVIEPSLGEMTYKTLLERAVESISISSGRGRS